MIEELEILKGIVGDLSGVSIWLMAGYIIMRISIVCAWVYTAKLVVQAAKGALTSEVTKDQYRAIDDENHSLKRDMEDLKVKTGIEVQEIKHLYKILKESKVEE